MMLQIKYGVRPTDAAKMTSRPVHKPATVIGSSTTGRELASEGFLQERFTEGNEIGDESADISRADDSIRDEITAALADAENEADSCMREEEEAGTEDGETRLDSAEKPPPALDLGELLRAQNVDLI
jgi:hypothetical protein